MSDNLPAEHSPEEKAQAEFDGAYAKMQEGFRKLGEALGDMVNAIREAAGGPKVVRSERLDKEKP